MADKSAADIASTATPTQTATARFLRVAVFTSLAELLMTYGPMFVSILAAIPQTPAVVLIAAILAALDKYYRDNKALNA